MLIKLLWYDLVCHYVFQVVLLGIENRHALNRRQHFVPTLGLAFEDVQASLLCFIQVEVYWSGVGLPNDLDAASSIVPVL